MDSASDLVEPDGPVWNLEEPSNKLFDSIKKNFSRKYSGRKYNSIKPTRLESKLEKNVKFKNKFLNHQLLTILNNFNKDKKFKTKNCKEKKKLLIPLCKTVNDKISRQVNFEELNKKVSEYDAIVQEIKHAEQLVFPANQEKINFKIYGGNILNSSKVNGIYINLENGIKKEIDNEKNIEENEKFLNDDELNVLTSHDLTQARKLHQEIQRRRIMISFQEAKFRRIRRIKSKNYHRMLNKGKHKKIIENFDKLVTENPEKALEKLNTLDRLRALERASLKHFNTGKWAKYSKIRAKYNEQSRIELNEQLKINQSIMKKRHYSSLNDDENYISDERDNLHNIDENNSNANILKDGENLNCTNFLEEFDMEKIESLQDSDKDFNCFDFNFNNNESNQYMHELENVLGNNLSQLNQKSNNEIENNPVYLPGWTKTGWAGFGIKDTRKKKLKQVNNFFRKQKMLDRKIGRAVFMASSKSTNGLGKQIKKPKGFTFNTEHSSQIFIEPKVIIKSGVIIDPLDSNLH